MAGVAKGTAHRWMRRNFQIVVNRIELTQRGLCLCHGIERRAFPRCHSTLVLALQAFTKAPQVGVLGFLFLDVRRIRQHHRKQVAGGAGGMDRALEAQCDQSRQQAGMVDVGMGEQDKVDGRRIEGKRLVVLGARFAPALEHAAIDQKAHPFVFHQIAGAGHFARRTEKSQFHSGLPSPASS